MTPKYIKKKHLKVQHVRTLVKQLTNRMWWQNSFEVVPDAWKLQSKAPMQEM